MCSNSSNDFGTRHHLGALFRQGPASAKSSLVTAQLCIVLMAIYGEPAWILNWWGILAITPAVNHCCRAFLFVIFSRTWVLWILLSTLLPVLSTGSHPRTSMSEHRWWTQSPSFLQRWVHLSQVCLCDHWNSQTEPLYWSSLGRETSSLHHYQHHPLLQIQHQSCFPLNRSLPHSLWSMFNAGLEGSAWYLIRSNRIRCSAYWRQSRRVHMLGEAVQVFFSRSVDPLWLPLGQSTIRECFRLSIIG